MSILQEEILMRIKIYKTPKKIHSIQQCMTEILVPLGFIPPEIHNQKHTLSFIDLQNKRHRVYVYTNSLMNVCLGYISLNLTELLRLDKDEDYFKFIKDKIKEI